MPEPLKNMYNRESVGFLATTFAFEYSGFRKDRFLKAVFDDTWPDRALKARMSHIATCLHTELPATFPEAVDILERVLPNLTEQGFEKMVFPDYVAQYGLDEWERSMAALELFTQTISAEFAIRPFINRYPERTMARMLAWAGHDHPGVRRLASEGCRPRLPWGTGVPSLAEDPGPILPILEQLKDDPSEDVRRSVANNLNDIARDHPAIVIDLLGRWQADDSAEMELISHALRGLIKKGDPDALALLGYGKKPVVAMHDLVLEPDEITLGQSLELSCTLESLADRPQRLMIDLVLHLVKANGQTAPKVFKMSKRALQPGQTVHLSKKISFQPITTRVYHPGRHAAQLQINGQLFPKVYFLVTPAGPELGHGN